MSWALCKTKYLVFKLLLITFSYFFADFSNYVIEAYKTKSKVQIWKSPPFRIYSSKCSKPVEHFDGCSLKDHRFGHTIDEKAPMLNVTKDDCSDICSMTKNCTYYSWNNYTRKCIISSLKYYSLTVTHDKTFVYNFWVLSEYKGLSTT